VKIHIWNAFASNNSGSYTIVGRFPSSEQAARVAAELAEALTAHDTWLKAEEEKQRAWSPEGPSPLREFIQRHGLTWEEGLGTQDDWPRYSKDAPEAWALGEQVIVHHDYTVTLPRTFGEFFYKRGGRVDIELEHAHHPIVGVFELWLPYGEHGKEAGAAKVSAVLEELNAQNGPLVTRVREGMPAAWRTSKHFIEPSLTVGAAFDDLAAGFTEVERIAQRHGMRVVVKVMEALSREDPVGFLRPSPPPREA
jgi:hypothetical protein